MPPVYAQQNDAAHRAQARNQQQAGQQQAGPGTGTGTSAGNTGVPSVLKTPTPVERLVSSPTTAERLVNNPGIWNTWSPPATNPPSGSIIGPVIGPAPQPSPSATGVQPPVAAPENPGSPITRNIFERDIFAVNAASGGKAQPYRNEFVFSPSTGGFEAQAESNAFAPGANTIQLFGGTSDEFRYNNTESQTPDRDQNINIGDTLWQTGGLINAVPNYQNEGSVGNENLGASVDVTAGLQATANAAYGYDGDTFKVGAAGEVFLGVEANAEAHASLGPVNAGVEAEAKVGLSAGANGGVTFDPRNGVSAEAGAQVFAGAELNLEASTGLGDSAEATAGLDLKAGIGAEASADIEFGLDEIGVDLEIGATLGIGADFSIDLSISPTGIVDDAGDVLSGAKNFMGGLISG